MKKSAVFALAVAGLFRPAAAQAQEQDQARARLQGTRAQQQAALARPTLDLPSELPALEAAVNPSTYIVGPGDKFYINIPNNLTEGFQTAVTAEGKLIIPTIGSLQASGKTLMQLQHDVAIAGSTKYLETRITANLIDLRTFRVHVLGEVLQPGIYALRQTYRLTDALQFAGGPSDWADLNSIELRRAGEEMQQYDLVQYLTRGDLQNNPQLLDGDVIFVPRVTRDLTAVRVEGRIQNPGVYFARPNESPQAFLLRIRGVTRKADVMGAVIKRGGAKQESIRTLPIFVNDSLAGLQDDHSPVATSLENGDIISIPSVLDSVYVQGAVFRPGPYPYYPNFMARDYAGLAGPNESAASFNGIRIRHQQSGEVEKGPDAPVRPGDTIEVKTATRTIFKDYLQIGATIVGQVLAFLTLREALRKR